MKNITWLGLAIAVGFCFTAVAQSATPAPDTARFSATYATALPSPVRGEWERDYRKYERFMTKDVARTQMGVTFEKDGIATWFVSNSARPHAQLDTATRIPDAAKLVGRWQSIAHRAVVHRDSAVTTEPTCHRSATLVQMPGQTQLAFADGKVTISTRPTPEAVYERAGRQKYALINGRYLLLYGLSKAGGSISLVGFDAANRLILRNCTATERRVRGRYITYQTVIQEGIFVRQ
ncbi:MAG: hypothetical protein H7330_10045 [Hymenobacteraceae bacterium]|nr:hypothetical protein [Hymenobacteraceae bacterium]